MDHFETDRPLTCKQFVEEFNAISENYVADTYLDYVFIYDAESGVSVGFDLARLDPGSCSWLYEFERAYSWKELMLMAKLAATPPMLRTLPKERKSNG